MHYYYLPENEEAEEQLYFKAIYDNLNTIREHKEDIIYKSSIPRLKQTKARGIQAFKQLLKRLSNTTKYDESIKSLWLSCFKLAYTYDCYALNVNGIKTIIFNKEIEAEKLKQLIKLDSYIYTNKEPNKEINKKELIKIVIDYIKNEDLSQADLIQVFIALLSHNIT